MRVEISPEDQSDKAKLATALAAIRDDSNPSGCCMVRNGNKVIAVIGGVSAAGCAAIAETMTGEKSNGSWKEGPCDGAE